ncbi:hypothetical protein ANMWB30_24150 [Arthrobacter sp. MWB30]|nr:hypothetical protein ANMWB30_24150 [Arthrobacter sp. MWB30]
MTIWSDPNSEPWAVTLLVLVAATLILTVLLMFQFRPKGPTSASTRRITTATVLVAISATVITAVSYTQVRDAAELSARSDLQSHLRITYNIVIDEETALSL